MYRKFASVRCSDGVYTIVAHDPDTNQLDEFYVYIENVGSRDTATRVVEALNAEERREC